jgi:hypothetical protein
MPVDVVNQSSEAANETVEVPAPTASPIVLAFGVTLVFAGMVTSGAVSVLGAMIAMAGVVGWFREVLPREQHESLKVDTEVPVVATARRAVSRIAVAPSLRRAWLPLEIYPISAGVWGGLAGSVAMAALAMLYGVVSQGSIWYPINLLAAGFFPETAAQTAGEMSAFHLSMFLMAVGLHLILSVLVGLLYGAMLPMLPRRPILLGGFIAPILWTGVVHSALGIVNPVLNQRIHWLWFVISQMGFGIVAGIVVSRRERVRTWQRLPLAFRAGMEGSGMHDGDAEEDRR